MAFQWLPCQAPGVIWSVLGLVGPVSVYCDWVRWKVWSPTFISVWQHVKLSERSVPGIHLHVAGTLSNQQRTKFLCVRCDDRAKSSGRWLLGSPPSAVVRQLAPRAWCPLQCLLAKTVGVLPPGVGRSEECAREFAPQRHIHSGLNQQAPVSSDVFIARSDQYADSYVHRRLTAIFHCRVSTHTHFDQLSFR